MGVWSENVAQGEVWDRGLDRQFQTEDPDLMKWVLQEEARYSL